jgi:hypothetical protein
LFTHFHITLPNGSINIYTCVYICTCICIENCRKFWNKWILRRCITLTQTIMGMSENIKAPAETLTSSYLILMFCLSSSNSPTLLTHSLTRSLSAWSNVLIEGKKLIFMVHVCKSNNKSTNEHTWMNFIDLTHPLTLRPSHLTFRDKLIDKKKHIADLLSVYVYT